MDKDLAILHEFSCRQPELFWPIMLHTLHIKFNTPPSRCAAWSKHSKVLYCSHQHRPAQLFLQTAATVLAHQAAHAADPD